MRAFLEQIDSQHRRPTHAAQGDGDSDRSAGVLLAEDNPINQSVIRRLLERLGHRVETASDGREAIEMVFAGHYDLVFMDVHMPVMNGLEAMQRIRAELPHARRPRLVALTGAVLPQDQEACREAGADDFLAKPVKLEEIRLAVSRALNGAP